MARFLIVAGLVLALLGVLLQLGWLRWFGNLPGDLRFENKSTHVYVPITSMLIVSAVLTLLSWLVRRMS